MTKSSVSYSVYCVQSPMEQLKQQVLPRRKRKPTKRRIICTICYSANLQSKTHQDAVNLCPAEVGVLDWSEPLCGPVRRHSKAKTQWNSSINATKQGSVVFVII